jgi:glutamyl-tRNA synthetase
LAWLSIRARGGHLILRMEDIDSPRVKPWATQQALDDLRWLGLDWDEGPDCPGLRAPYVQSQRLPSYQAVLEQLRGSDSVYPCGCSRRDVQVAASAPHAGQEGTVYPGTCAHRRAGDIRGDARCAWRLRTSDTLRVFEDRVAGPQQVRVRQELGDFVVFKADQTPAYQLAVVVDDHQMGITEVVRGDDLIPSTFRQLELYEHFGWSPPQFAHVPLVVGADGRRLAKRHGDTRLASLRAAGVRPQAIVGLLAWSCGLIEAPVARHPGDLLEGFTLERLRGCPPLVVTPQMVRELARRT